MDAMDSFQLRILVATVIVALTVAPHAMAADPSGTVIAMVPAVEANGAVGKRRLSVNANIFMGDSIATGAVGEVQIRLADDTKLVLGPRSALFIDEFVLNSAGSADKVALKAVRGAFRFITGNSRKQAYKITTPTATIGIRGTKFDFGIGPDGTTAFAVFEGEMQVCDRRRRRCVVLGGGCSIASVGPSGEPRQPETLEQRQKVIDDFFPFIRNERRLGSGFSVGSTGCETRRARRPASPQALPPVTASLPPDPVVTGSVSGNPGNTKNVGGSGNKFDKNPGNMGNSGN
jgi:hypothetical protein